MATRKNRARERIAAAREAERQRRLRRRVIAGAIAAAVVVAIGVLWAVLPDRPGHRTEHVASRSGSSGTPTGGPGGQHRPGTGVAASAGTALPPWPRPADTASRAGTIGLAVGPMEGTAVHFHVHLDVLVDGRPVPVPADLGIGEQGLSELHTHDTSGVLHIEAPSTGKRYSLGQLFAEWNVRLDATDLGGLRAGTGRTLTAYVDGRKQTGDPAAIALTPHREIALVYGSATAKTRVPSTYAFSQGL
jgi:hypothetical protein